MPSMIPTRFWQMPKLNMQLNLMGASPSPIQSRHGDRFAARTLLALPPVPRVVGGKISRWDLR